MSYHSFRFHFAIYLMIFFLTGCQTPGPQSWKSWLALQPEKDEAADSRFDSLRPSAVDDEVADVGAPRRNSATKIPVAAERVDILLQQGHQAILDGRHEDARKAFNEVLAADPDNAKAHHGIAIVADLAKDWSTAEFHYRQALKQNPRDANLLNDLGYSYYLQNRFHDAEGFLNQAAAIQPEHQTVQVNLARLSLRQGNRAEAEERLMKLFPAATARQHLTMLEGQLRESQPELAQTPAGSTPPAFNSPALSSNDASSPSGTLQNQNIPDPNIPPNATLDEIRQLAELRRLAAEQERLAREANRGSASLGTPIPLGPGGNMISIPNVAGTGNPAPDPIVQPGFITHQNPAPAVTGNTGAVQNPIQTAGYPGHPNGAQIHTAGQDLSPGVPYGFGGSQNSGGAINTAQLSQPLGQPIAAPVEVQPAGYYQAGNQNSGQGQNSLPAGNQMPLVGLNAGPGALFPVNGGTNSGMAAHPNSNPYQNANSYQNPNPYQAPMGPQTNQPSFGPNTMNPNPSSGMYYGPNGATPNPMLPNQQNGFTSGGNQSATGAVNTGSQSASGGAFNPGLPTNGGMSSVGNTAYPNLPGPTSNPNLVPPQYSIPAQDWARQQQAYGQQLNQQSRRSAFDSQVAAPNPLEAYQQQLQSEQPLNQSLDRMNRQSSIAPVQAQY